MNPCYCCFDFDKATLPCTDAEEMYELIRRRNEAWRIGAVDLKPIRFCPWCGKKVAEWRGSPTVESVASAVSETSGVPTAGSASLPPGARL